MRCNFISKCFLEISNFHVLQTFMLMCSIGLLLDVREFFFARPPRPTSGVPLLVAELCCLACGCLSCGRGNHLSLGGCHLWQACWMLTCGTHCRTSDFSQSTCFACSAVVHTRVRRLPLASKQAVSARLLFLYIFYLSDLYMFARLKHA